MVKWMKLTVINDNEPNPPLLNDWGWSILIETDKWVLLYDADTEPGIMENNINALGIDLRGVNAAFLSHYHADHYGGFRYIGEVKRGLVVYVPEEDKILAKWGLRPVTVNSPSGILEDAVTTGVMRGMGVNEHSLIVKLDGYGPVIIVGCSHPGIDNIVKRVYEMFNSVYLVIGGFHEPLRHQLNTVVEYSRYVCPAHCSGDDARSYVKNNYPEKYCGIKTGVRLRLPM
ncbi:MBL fold metallo-hydrolase [Caldivirga maquilingensis]|uniref:Beta-lactamase domain protein n=1 Tax=Caldivirga maquilingensis (strain ATCC 700844 / DSM 13496 / JCM 10307 / IC-167) TaxID=397948 RepID=A8MDE6_CALMQ|nr:MBL fold metallo-hydrolase [Caldivirga maquilingensis]ABW01802.1 beta-lactamase domain protein [Caldivirga maquilingensis IC-167]